LAESFEYDGETGERAAAIARMVGRSAERDNQSRDREADFRRVHAEAGRRETAAAHRDRATQQL
jgi:hypothetical protein